VYHYDVARGHDVSRAQGLKFMEDDVDHLECCTALENEVARFANVMSTMSRDEEVASCPGWNVVDLAEHLSMVHRWAEELVRRRSPQRISRMASVENRDDVSPKWIEEGGRRLVATLRDADPNDEMWAWGRDQHVQFWSRRQLHETLVHRMDLELAAQLVPTSEPAIALDAIDEYLSNIEKVATNSPDLSQLRGNGETLLFRPHDSPVKWSITFDGEGFRVSRDETHFDAELAGSPVDLLLAILRRRGVDEGEVAVKGDRTLVDFWLAHSAFD
jgi:uncharacterized protein (TIGR03083 family)